MAYDLATVTNSGNQLLASVISDKSSLVIDKIEVSNTKLASSTDLKSMTSISNVVQTLSANGYQKKDNSFIISTVLDNSSVTADYKAWVFGIWAHETDGGSPILMSVITSTSSPDTISKGSGTPIDYNYKFITTFSNTSSLTIQMASDTYATNDTVLHNSGDETATGTKTFQEIKISNDKFPSLVQTDGQYITLDGGNTEIVPADNSKVVHDNQDGTEQLNGVQVQPFNKLSDTIGGRNLLLGTSPVKVRNSTWTNHINVDVTNLVGTTLTYSAMLDITDSTQGAVGVILTPRDSSGKAIGDSASSNSINWGNVGKAIATITIPTGASNLDIDERTNNTDQNPLVGSRKLEKGSIATDWTPAPEDKVNVSDMRKSASDVAGIEEVNTKQDKIGYTPADDSKVVHDNHDNTITANNLTYDLSKSVLAPLQYISSGSYNDLPLGTVLTKASSMTEAPFTEYEFTTTTFFSSKFGVRKVQIAIADYVNLMYFRAETEISWNSWTLLSDDSKVAHLSGANNFDTVPTVDDNPLLLASSLPSDLARTGSDQEFTGKNTFDTAPIDKTTGNPYITKDGVPSDVAQTGQDANFTGKLQKGGIDVATAADLKSVEADAWHVAESSYPGLLMQVDRDDKIIYILSTGDPTTTRVLDQSDDEGASNIICDLSSYIDKIVSASGYITVRDIGQEGVRYALTFRRAELIANDRGDNILGGGGYSISGDPSVLNNTSAFLKLQYNSWIGK